MKFKSIVLSALFVNLTAMPFVAFANAENSTPANCPRPNEIKATNLIDANLISEADGWVALQQSNYGGSQDWRFGLFYIKAKNKNAALSKAYTGLSTLSNAQGPFHANNGGWYCKYSVGHGYEALVETNSTSSLLNLQKMLG